MRDFYPGQIVRYINPNSQYNNTLFSISQLNKDYIMMYNLSNMQTTSTGKLKEYVVYNSYDYMLEPVVMVSDTPPIFGVE